MLAVETRQSIILAADPGMLRNALQNLFSTLPNVGILVLTGDLPSLLSAIEKHAPALIVLDDELLVSESEAAAAIMLAGATGSTLLVLVTDVEQQHLIGSGQNHEVLFKGVHPEVLSQRVESILRSFVG